LLALEPCPQGIKGMQRHFLDLKDFIKVRDKQFWWLKIPANTQPYFGKIQCPPQEELFTIPNPAALDRIMNKRLQPYLLRKNAKKT